MKRPLKMLFSFVPVLALLMLPSMTTAQSIEPAKVDELVQEAVKAWQVPGAAVAVVRGDEVLYLKGVGVRELAGDKPVTPDTLFAIASTSKAFTAMAIAMQVSDGTMKWDDPVSQYIDFFHLSDPLADRNLTLRDLVTHRTGLSRHDFLWIGSNSDREDILRRIGLVKLDKPFRSAYQYQNIMYLAAGYAVGKATHSSWEEVVQKRIFDPLGMKGANFSTKSALQAADHATPHLKKSSKVEAISWRNIDNVGPAGAINAGVRDLSKWLRFQLGDGSFEGKRLISAAKLAETHNPQMVIPLDGTTGVTSFTREMNPETNIMNYGLGWVIQDYRGQLLLSHGGSIDGFRAQVALLPKQKIGIAILSNLGQTQMPEALRNSLVDHFLTAPKKDWNAHYQGLAKKQELAQKAREKAREAKRHPGTKPSRDLAAFTGSYEEPAYGMIEVILDKSALAMKWHTYTINLEHFHFDTFTTGGDPAIEKRDVVFALNADGDVGRLQFLEQEFKRVKTK